MTDAEILESLFELAREAGIEVRLVGSASGGEEGPAPSSGVCRVRGELWVVLARSEPPELQIDVLAAALRSHAAALIEERFLPPAVRARVERARPRGPGTA